MASGTIVKQPNIPIDFQNYGNISSIKTYIDTLPSKKVDIKCFYNAPSDAPAGTGNWNYTLVTFKSDEANTRTYCLLFYPGKLFVGNLNSGTLTWNEATLA